LDYGWKWYDKQDFINSINSPDFPPHSACGTTHVTSPSSFPAIRWITRAIARIKYKASLLALF